MIAQQERVGDGPDHVHVRNLLGVIGAKLAELGTDAAADRVLGEGGPPQDTGHVISELERIATLLDTIDMVLATGDLSSLELEDTTELNNDTFTILSQLFAPEDIQLIAQLEGEQRHVFLTLLQKLWVKYSGPRGKSSSIQTNRFKDMYVEGHTAQQVADAEGCPRSVVAKGLETLVTVLSRSPTEERTALVGQAQSVDSKAEAPAAAPFVPAIEPVAKPVPGPARPVVAVRVPPATTRPEQVPLAPREWVVNRNEAIAKALRGRYGDNDTSMYQAIDTMLSAGRLKFTPNQKEVLDNILNEVGIHSGQSIAESAQAILDLPGVLRDFGLSDDQMKVFAKFVGLSVSVREDAVTILGATAPRPVGQIMAEGRNGLSLNLLDVQVLLAQAFAHFLRGTAPPQ